MILGAALQASLRFSLTFGSQAGGCAYNAFGVVRPTRNAGSLRSARRGRCGGRIVNAASERATRTERLYVRLTAEEAAHVAHLADLRGLTVSDFVREVALKRSGFRWRVGRRALPSDSAATIRQLSSIGADLRRLAAIAESNGAVRADKVTACLAQLQAVIGSFGP